MPAGARQQKPDRNPPCRGREVGHGYRLVRPLREDSVWLATDRSLQAFALKTGPRPFIEREYQTVVRLTHPNIVAAVDYIDAADAPWIVFEYLPGGDLVSLAGLAPSHWLPAVTELVTGVAWLHARGIVHRDIKARNVMFGADGRARLIDFGSAAAAGSPWTGGGTTAVAVAPGRGTGPVAGPVTAADDAYAVAALIHELSRGAPPDAAAGAGLARFAAGIESLLEQKQA